MLVHIMRDVITEVITKIGKLPAYKFAHQATANFTATQPEYSKCTTQAQCDAEAMKLPEQTRYDEDNPIIATLNTSESHKAIAVAAMLK